MLQSTVWSRGGSWADAGTHPSCLRLPEERDAAPLPTFSPASGCVAVSPGRHAQTPLTTGSSSCQVEGEGPFSKGVSMCESGKLPFGNGMSFSFNMVPCCILSL